METPCEEFAGCKDGDGYGIVERGGKTFRAHRVAWSDKHGPILNGLWVLHKCDNPSCVKIEHLFLGSAKDNIQDCIAKNRRNTPFGEKHHASKLSDNTVVRLRIVGDLISRVDLARALGVSLTSICRMGSGKTRKYARRSSI